MPRQIRTAATVTAHRLKMAHKRRERAKPGSRDMAFVAPKPWVRVTPRHAAHREF
jgi:hypothetical protein